jgi:putative two-component system response regulator
MRRTTSPDHGKAAGIDGDHAAARSIPKDTDPGRVIIVDDCPANLRLLTRQLADDGYVVHTATNGDEALDLIAREQPDVVLMDVMMPRRDGYETCRALKQSASTRLIPVVLVTALRDSRDKVRGLEAGADDFLTKPVNTIELRARVRSLMRLKRYTDDLESAEAVMLTLGETIEARDAYTDGHCQRLAAYALALGRALGLAADELAALEYGGFLHDIGKIGVPDALLLKPASLTADEHQRMQQHTIIGDRLCGELRSLRTVRPIVRHHHERLDGTGYPSGLRGSAIPLLAQVVGIVDVYDALTTARPYKEALPTERACEELRDEAQRGWRRPDLVEMFIQATDDARVRDASSPGERT